MKIEITNSQADSRTHGQLTFRSQQAYLHSDNKKYPDEIKISLADDQAPYPLGFYTVDFNENIYVDKYKSVSLSRQLILKPEQKLSAAK